jgi:hypothetical protein
MTPERESAAPDPGSWTSRVEARGSRHVLHLSGAFHAGWAGRLAGGLAARQVSVVRAMAQRGKTHQWTAELEVEVLDPALDLSTIDCLALIRDRSEPAPPPGDLVLTSYRLVPRPGALEVAVTAPDAVGQLDRVLRTFAFFGLFPCALRLETRGASMDGLFQLQALGQTEPRLQVIEGLERRLAGLVPGDEEGPRGLPARAASTTARRPG